MSKNLTLDRYEQDIENNYENLKAVRDMENEIDMLKTAAFSHSKRKRSITLRVKENDLETIRIKASKLGIPYQTYINMLIHKDAISGI